MLLAAGCWLLVLLLAMAMAMAIIILFIIKLFIITVFLSLRKVVRKLSLRKIAQNCRFWILNYFARDNF